ncbi:MAG: preprotein translocase subunit SecG [Acidobacteriota bacterium]
MTILLTIIHVLVCLILILIVLLQSGKSADLAGAFGGGGSQTAFGARGTATFLSKLTTGAAVIFMLTSFTLSIVSTRQRASSVMEGTRTPASTTPAPSGSAPTAPAAAPGTEGTSQGAPSSPESPQSGQPEQKK